MSTQDQKNINSIDIDALLKDVEAGPLLTAPAYLKDEIMKKSQSISIQAPIKLAKQKKEISRQLQLFYYSLKISAAVLICLFQLVLVGKLPGISFSLNSAVSDYRYEQLKNDAVQKEEVQKEELSLPNINQLFETLKSGGHLQ